MIDDIDMKIMDLLANNGRMPILELSKKLSIPNSTARKRIKRLEDEGIINFFCEVNCNMFPQILIMLVGIVVSKKYIGQHEDIYKIPNIIHVSGSTGRYDFIAMYAAASRDMIIDVISQLNDMESVERTESFLMLRSIGTFIKSDKFSKLYKAYTDMKE